MRRFLGYVLPVLVYAGVIFFLSGRPSTPGPELPYFDKAVHFGAWFVLALLLHRAFVGYEASEGGAFAWSWVIALAYGLTDELHQSLVPPREPSIADLTADGLGAFVALWAISTLRRRRTLPQRRSS